MAQLDKLPEEMLRAIFECFVAPVYTTPAMQGVKWSETPQDHATLASLCLVNRHLGRAARPFFWRHCMKVLRPGRTWLAILGIYARTVPVVELADCMIVPGGPWSVSPCSFINTLYLSLSMDKDSHSQIDDILGSCTNLAFLYLNIEYSGIEISPDMDICHASMQRMGRSIERLKRMIHLHLNFEYRGSINEYDAYEHHLAYITAFPPASLCSLTLERSPWGRQNSIDQDSLPMQIHIRIGDNVAHSAIETIGFRGEHPSASIFRIMQAVGASERIHTMSLGRVGIDFLDAVPDNMCKNIKRLVLDPELVIQPTTIFKFRWLQTLEWPLHLLWGYSSRTQAHTIGYHLHTLERLKLYGYGKAFLAWARDRLPDPLYMPNLRSLSIKIDRSGEGAPLLELDLAVLIADVAPFRHLKFRED